MLAQPSPEELRAHIASYDALIIRSNVSITAELLEAAPQLKVIGRAGVGLDNIDLQAASLYGVLVMNTPDANTTTTAEHTFALLLALCRHVPQAHNTILSGNWDREQFMGTQLRGKTLGIIGFGRIGKQVAHLAQAFGMTILVADP